LLKKSDGFEMSERKELGWGASRISRSVEDAFLNQTCVAPWPNTFFQQTAITLRFLDFARIRRGTGPSSTAVGVRIGVTHHTVQRCLRRAVRLGVMAALDDSPRPGKAPQITEAAKAWLVSLACQKGKDFGYPHELWTTRLLARHARTHAMAAGYACLTHIAKPGLSRRPQP
jgi:hypothetical protein